MLTNDTSAPLILVVEDDVGHYELIQCSFKNVVEKYRIANVSNLHDARAALGRLSPGLVLVDHELPGGNGRDFVAMANRLWPIILMIDQGNEQMAMEAMETGAQDYIVKSEGMFLALPGIVKIALREKHAF